MKTPRARVDEKKMIGEKDREETGLFFWSISSIIVDFLVVFIPVVFVVNECPWLITILMICSFFQVLWKAYIDFEIEQEEHDRTRDLYERLLKRTQHVKV